MRKSSICYGKGLVSDLEAKIGKHRKRRLKGTRKQRFKRPETALWSHSRVEKQRTWKQRLEDAESSASKAFKSNALQAFGSSALKALKAALQRYSEAALQGSKSSALNQWLIRASKESIPELPLHRLVPFLPAENFDCLTCLWPSAWPSHASNRSQVLIKWRNLTHAQLI